MPVSAVIPEGDGACLLVEAQDVLDVARGADDHGTLVVDAGGRDVQYADDLAAEWPGRRESARLLDDHGHREALV